MKTPLEKLEDYLRLYHPYYSIDDVVLSPVKGYLETTKPCQGNCPLCRGGHFHTIDIYGVGYPERNSKGRYISPYRLWRELHGLLPDKKSLGGVNKHD